jgi:3-(3-hydroxy-phenyl)propionate hydroxylase
MTPPGRGHALLRDAALSLAVTEDFARALVNPRQSSAIAFPASALQTPEQGEWVAGPAPGATLPSIPLGTTHIQALVGPHPTLLLAPGDAAAEAWCAGRQPVLLDAAAAARLGLAAPGAGYLVRPDGHVAWRWQRFDATALEAALARLMGY